MVAKYHIKKNENLESHVITTKNVSSILSKLDIRDWGNNLSEKGSRTRCFLLLKSAPNWNFSWVFKSTGCFYMQDMKKKIIFFKTSKGTYNLEWESHNADCRKSIKRMDPFELLYANILQWVGWNSADVITSTEAQGKLRIQSLRR